MHDADHRFDWRALVPVILALSTLLAGCGGPGTDSRPVADAACHPPEKAQDYSWGLGCATQRNLAVMAANPNDLILARRATPRDAMKRDAVIGSYARNGVGAGAGAKKTPSGSGQPVNANVTGALNE